MRSKTVLLGLALVCLASAPVAQAAWGFKSADVKAPTPVDAAASPIPAADPIDASGFADAGPAGTPPPPPYDGVEYSYWGMTFRPALFKLEGLLLASIIAYVLYSFFGIQQNRAHATAWVEANEPVYKEEFAGVGLGDQAKMLAEDGGDEFLLYATGRRGVVHAWTKVQTQARHDLFTRLYHFGRGLADFGYRSGEDLVTVDMKLAAPTGTPGAKFCFSVVDRKDLRALLDARWDLRELTTTSEQAGVEPSLIITTENGDVTKAMLSPETGLKAAIAPGAKGLEWFQSLVVTDGPAAKPDEEKPTLPQDEYHLILTLRLPPKSRCAETRPWISLACNIADVLTQKQKLVPDVQVNKLKKRRVDALAPFLAAIAAASKEEEAAKQADALALKKKLDKEREEAKLAKMSKSERIKYFEKIKEQEKKEQLKKLTKRAR